jgi:hypothetical protein
LLSEPRIASSLTSQLLAGEVVTVLEMRESWMRVCGADGYEGWTHGGYLTDTAGSEATWRHALGCQVRDARGVTRSLPLGARVSPAEEVISGHAIDADELTTRFPGTSDAIAASAAARYEGASYLWGGVTPWGCDCSGLVQRAFALHGVMLPRDAWQQALLGTSLSSDAVADHAPGALLFFSDREDGRVTHVGVALGDHRMVHSALARGGVAIEDMQGDDPYVIRLRAQCVAVRQVIDR